MKILNLTLKKKWFDMIASGEKKEEYREIKPYWATRLLSGYNSSLFETPLDAVIVSRDYDLVSANNGYAKECPNIKWFHWGTRIGEGKTEWGAEPGVKYFILDIGPLYHG